MWASQARIPHIAAIFVVVFARWVGLLPNIDFDGFHGVWSAFWLVTGGYGCRGSVSRVPAKTRKYAQFWENSLTGRE